MDSNRYASLLGCYWFHVIYFFMLLHEVVVKLEVDLVPACLPLYVIFAL